MYKCKKCGITAPRRYEVPDNCYGNGIHQWYNLDFSNDTKWGDSLVGRLVGGIWRLRIAGVPVGKIFIIGAIAIFVIVTMFR